MLEKILLSLAALLAVAAVMQAQELPYDPELRKGVLENGMTYYIRHNGKPEGQAEFWIVHNVGAVQEEDSQQGLAHFLEHMAFNGTANFPGKRMMEWLEGEIRVRPERLHDAGIYLLPCFQRAAGT